MRCLDLVAGVADTPARRFLDPLPPGTELVPLGANVAADDFSRVEFLISGDSDLGPRVSLMPSLRVIQTLSAGVDWLAGRVPEGVRVYNAAGVFDEPLAEWVLAAVLAMERGLPRAWSAGLRHAWEPYVPGQLRGTSVVILGYGSIGRAVERLLKPFGVKLTRVARTPRPGISGIADLDTILPATRVLIVLLPLTASTDGLLDRRRLGLLPPGALLVNAGRGRVVDTDALREEALTGRLRAVLDVVEPEPLPSGDLLWTIPGVLITPHVAGDSPDTEEHAHRLAGEQLRRYAAGRPLSHPVAPYLLEPGDW